MDKFLEQIASINDVIYDYVWIKIGLFLLLGSGILLTCCTRFFQVFHSGHWFKNTFGSIFSKGSQSTKNNSKTTISQFQALCTALAATIGTGNIAGVSAAIILGGPGAVFWMWVAAFFGMMTKFSEAILGLYYRRRNTDGEWSGGAMYYLKDGLGKLKGCKVIGSVLAVLFAIFTILASFGIGNMGQVNKITLTMQSAFFKNVDLGTVAGMPVVNLIIGGVLLILSGLIIIGGLQRLAAVAEKLVPFMAITYAIGSLIIIGLHITQIGAVFAAIFKFAFGVKAVGGAVAGITVKAVITQGCKRGVFSNEAGLGSSALVHASSNATEPVKQGMWGILEVFLDTFVVCTMTALVVLTSGQIDLTTGFAAAGANDATLVSQAFSSVFGYAGEIFMAIAMFLFAYTTVLGWSQYGAKAVEYLFGTKAVKVYKAIFVLMILSGAVMTSSLAWDISDTCNGLMMIPNLIGVLVLMPTLSKIVKNYVNRHIKGKNDEPMLSYDPEIQKELLESTK